MSIGRGAFRFLVVAAVAAVAEPLTWNGLVGGYTRDLSLSATRQKVGELGASHAPQLWEDLEFRYAAKRSDLRKQEFALRLSPSGFGEIGANRGLVDARRSLGNAVLRRKSSEAIRDRYKIALDWRYQTAQRRYHLQMAELFANRIAALAKLTSDEKFDPEDLVKAQVKRAEFLAKAEGDLYKLAQIEHRMRLYVPDMTTVSLEGELLSPMEVELVLADSGSASSDRYPDAQVAGEELGLVKAKTDQQIASTRRWLTYLEAGWTVDVDENSKERATVRDNIAFGGGIKIPLFDGSSQEIARRRADLAEARLDYQDDVEDVERDVAELRISIGSMLRQLVVLDSFAAKVDAGGLFADFALKTGGDPLLVLSARQTSVDSRWMIDDLRFQMLYAYLEILHLTGVLVEHPGVNHLLTKAPPLALLAPLRSDGLP